MWLPGRTRSSPDGSCTPRNGRSWAASVLPPWERPSILRLLLHARHASSSVCTGLKPRAASKSSTFVCTRVASIMEGLPCDVPCLRRHSLKAARGPLLRSGAPPPVSRRRIYFDQSSVCRPFHPEQFDLGMGGKGSVPRETTTEPAPQMAIAALTRFRMFHVKRSPSIPSLGIPSRTAGAICFT